MRIVVTQVKNEYASAGVVVYVQGTRIGSIGPGDTVEAQVPDTDRCEVRVECGFYRKSMVLVSSADLLVSWSLKPPDIVLERRK